jgi:RNA recognition motif-containing protein
VVTIKVIRNRHSGVSEGYGFVEFYSHASAEKALQNFSGHVMPNTDRAFKLNWASYSMGEKRSEVASDHSIFVGDLAVDVTDDMLMELFASKYRSVKGAKVIIDANTGRSRGYGFVRFGDDNDKTHAMTEMNGVYCSTRSIRVGPATPRRSSGISNEYCCMSCPFSVTCQISHNIFFSALGNLIIHCPMLSIFLGTCNPGQLHCN